MRLVLMTSARQPTTEVLPALGLLAHSVRGRPEVSGLLAVTPATSSSSTPATTSSGPHAVLAAVHHRRRRLARRRPHRGRPGRAVGRLGRRRRPARHRRPGRGRRPAAAARRRPPRTPADGADRGVTSRRAGHRRAHLHGQAPGPPARPHLQGVRAAQVPGPAPRPGLHPRAAAAGGLGLRLLRRHPHGRRARPPAARQARHRARGADRHRPQRRLQVRPAGRRRDRRGRLAARRRRPEPV